MPSRDVDVDSPALHSPTAARMGLPQTRRDQDFEALASTGLAGRFVSWKGLSGKAYVFTVYPASDRPAFCDAVLVAASRDSADRRRALALIDTGPFPEPALDRVRRDIDAGSGALELHVHLLSRSPAERREAIADLKGALFPCRR